MLFSSSDDKPFGSVKVDESKWIEEVSRQSMLDDFSGWGDDVVLMINSLDSASKWSIHAVNPPLPTFSKDGIVLIGDAVWL